jgi:hypothetical protein
MGQTYGIVCPGFRQVEGAIDEGMAVPGYVGGKHPDLAVGDLAGRPGVLAPHAARRLTLLKEACFVDHQHRIRVGQRLERILAHHVAQRIRIPPAAAKDGLLTPRPTITCRLGSHPPCLASLRPEQAIKEQTRRRRHPHLRKQGPQPRFDLPQRRRPQLQRRLHRCNHDSCPTAMTRVESQWQRIATVMLVSSLSAL